MTMSGDGSTESASRAPETSVSSEGPLSAGPSTNRNSPAQARQAFFIVPVRTGPQHSPADPHPVERMAQFHRCNSSVRQLKQRIGLQIEEIRALIDDGKNERQATELLNELTIELMAAALALWAKRDERPGGEVIGTGDGPVIQDYRSLCDPEQLSVLGRIYDHAVAALPEEMRTHGNRKQIAKLVLGRAVVAELDPDFLIRFVVAVSSAV